MRNSLFIDLYELQTAARYVRQERNSMATFALYVSELPHDYGFVVVSGVNDCVEYARNFGLTARDATFLRSIGLSQRSVDALRRIRFTGDLWAVSEGRIVFRGEPILEVHAPIAEASLLQTYFLNQIASQSMLTTKAVRCRMAAAGAAKVVDYSARYAQGVDVGMLTARACAIAGFDGTTNPEASRQYGLKPTGTMSRAFVQSFGSEEAAFRAVAHDMTGSITFLVDTYDTIEGTRHAISVIRRMHLEETASVRIDGGDVLDASFIARRVLDDNGLHNVGIVVSGFLDENEIARLVEAAAPIDAIATAWDLDASAPLRERQFTYELTEYAGKPVANTAALGTFHAGRVQVYRCPAASGDLLALHDEQAGPASSRLLEPYLLEGERARLPESVETARERLSADLEWLTPASKQLRFPELPHVDMSDALAHCVRKTHRFASA